ncbi:hypothetical protein, partial [Escherichia coli]|uniref:hypothetical protein n=1 Tax=Escherichia coli TaxID=562 RepID=UPI001FF6BBD6
LPDFLSVGSDQHPERQRFVVQSSGTQQNFMLSGRGRILHFSAKYSALTGDQFCRHCRTPLTISQT